MKKITHILVAGLLFFSTTGISMTKHFCGGMLKEVTIVATPSHCCGDTEMPENCCQNESKNYVVDDELLPQYGSKLVFPLVAHQIMTYAFLVEIKLANTETPKLNYAFQPPPFTHPDIYIQVQSFLI